MHEEQMFIVKGIKGVVFTLGGTLKETYTKGANPNVLRQNIISVIPRMLYNPKKPGEFVEKPVFGRYAKVTINDIIYNDDSKERIVILEKKGKVIIIVERLYQHSYQPLSWWKRKKLLWFLKR